MYEVTLQMEDAAVKRRFMSAVGLMSGVKVVKRRAAKPRKCGLDKALEDVAAGRVYETESLEDFFRQMRE